ncbi:MAG: sensor histidine kinase [Rhodospirillaceae bacterium]
MHPALPRLRTGLTTLWANSAFRIALGYLLLFGFSAGLLLGGLYWLTHRSLMERVDLEIRQELNQALGFLQRRGPENLVASMNRRTRRGGTGVPIYLIEDPQGQILGGALTDWPEEVTRLGRAKTLEWSDLPLRPGVDPCPPSPPRPDRPPPQGDKREHIWDRLTEEHDNEPEPWDCFIDRPFMDDDGAVRVIAMPIHGGGRMLVARDITLLSFQLARMADILWIGFLVMILLGLGGGVIAARRMGRRLEAINSTARRIMEGDLSERMPERGGRDDFDQLSANLNAMLDRIERLMDGVRHVSDSIAHDLRTPLTRLRNRLERLVQETETLTHMDVPTRAGSEVVQREAEAALAETDSLLATFRALLRISQVETGGRRSAFAAVDLSILAADAQELYEPLAEDREIGWSATVSSPVMVTGDKDLLFQMLANLFDNAVKYSPAGSLIRFALSPASPESGYAARITLSDQGPGIPEADREAVFRRFHRVEASRSTPGNGLGLALVAAVVESHGGRISLEDSDPEARSKGTAPGLKIQVDLP